MLSNLHIPIFGVTGRIGVFLIYAAGVIRTEENGMKMKISNV